MKNKNTTLFVLLNLSNFLCSFCRLLFVLLSFIHLAIVCPSMYVLWLALWYLQTVLLKISNTCYLRNLQTEQLMLPINGCISCNLLLTYMPQWFCQRSKLYSSTQCLTSVYMVYINEKPSREVHPWLPG